MTQTPFEQILDALAHDSKPFSEKYLQQFSDLGKREVKLLKSIWAQVPGERKQALLQNLHKKYTDDLLMSFDALAANVLDDEDPMVRALALRLLWESEDPHLIPELVRILLYDPAPEVRAEAASVLGSFVELGEMDELPEGALSSIENALLQAATEEGYPALQRNALEALGYSSRPEVPALLEAAAKHKDPLWVGSAVFAMGRSGDTRWAETVVGLINHDTPAVRLAAVEAAGALGIKIALPALYALLEEEEDDGIFREVVWSISEIGGEDSRTYLENLLDITEDDELLEYLEEALENLDFTNDMERFDLINFDEDDLPDDAPPKRKR